MKRIISFVLIALSIFSVNAMDTQAATTEIAWSNLPLYATHNALQGVINVADDTYGVEFYVPKTDFHVISVGGVNSYINFKDALDNVILEINLFDLKGNDPSGYYSFNFQSYEIENAATITIVITQTYSSIPGGYLDFINDNDDLMWNYDYGIQMVWNSVNLYANYYSIQTRFSVVSDARLISIFIPQSQYHTTSIGGVNDSINFYDNTDTLIETYRLNELNFNLISGLYKLDIQDDLELSIGEISYITIVIPQTYEALPNGYIEYMNNESVLGFNDRLYRVNFYVGSELYVTDLFNLIPNQPSNPLLPSGTYFEGWYLANGSKYEFTNVTDTMLFNNELNLYAKTTNRPPIDTDLGDPEPSEFFGTIFETLGMNSQVGYVIVYLITIIISLVGLKSINLPNIVLMIVMLLITALFMFMGFLPVLMAIVAFGVIALILFSNMGGAV